MFGLNKIKEMKKQAEESKIRLDSIQVEGSAVDGKIKVRCTANRNIVAIDIDQAIYNVWDKEKLQQAIIEASNNALSKAEAIAASEMKSMLPNIPGLGL